MFLQFFFFSGRPRGRRGGGNKIVIVYPFFRTTKGRRGN